MAITERGTYTPLWSTTGSEVGLSVICIHDPRLKYQSLYFCKFVCENTAFNVDGEGFSTKTSEKISNNSKSPFNFSATSSDCPFT